MAAQRHELLVEPAVEADVEELKHRQRALHLRLEDGYQQIEQGLAEGRDVTRWEEFWARLLAEYEVICDTLREMERA